MGRPSLGTNHPFSEVKLSVPNISSFFLGENRASGGIWKLKTKLLVFFAGHTKFIIPSNDLNYWFRTFSLRLRLVVLSVKYILKPLSEPIAVIVNVCTVMKLVS